MALLYSNIAKATVAAGTNSIAVKGMDISGIFQGMVIHLGANDRVKGDGLIISGIIPNGTDGGTLSTIGPSDGGFTDAPFVIDTRDFNGTAPNYLIAMQTIILQSLLKLTSPLTNLFSGSRVLALDKDAPGAVSRLMFAILGRTWATLEQRTLSYLPTGGVRTEIETLAIRAYPDGTSPVDAILIDATTGGVDALATAAGMVAAPTVDIASAPARKIAISGDATITSFGPGKNKERIVTFLGKCKLVHSAALSLPGDKDMSPAYLEAFLATSSPNGEWRLRSFQSAAAIRGDVVQDLTAAEKAQARVNMGANEAYARPRNRFINPGFRFSQEYGQAEKAGPAGAGIYMMDGWVLGVPATGVDLRFQQVVAPSPGGSYARCRITIKGLSPDWNAQSPALTVVQRMELAETIDLGWGYGGAFAKNAAIQFCLNFPAGRYTASLRCRGGDALVKRTYIIPFDITSAEAGKDTIKSFKFPADTFSYSIGIPSSIHVTASISIVNLFNPQPDSNANKWISDTDSVGLASQSNGLFVGAVFEIADAGFYVADEAPKFELISHSQDVDRCLRYFQSYTAVLVSGTTPGTGAYAAYIDMSLPVIMRVAPNFAITQSQNSNSSGGVALNSSNDRHFRLSAIYSSAGPGNFYAIADIFLDARM